MLNLGIPIDEMYPSWTPHTLWQRFEINTKRFANRDFYVFESGAVSYASAYHQVYQVAKALWAAGVRKGDHVVLLLHNCPEFIQLTFAIAAIGAVKVPVNAKVGNKELEYILSHANADFLFSKKHIAEEVYALLPRLRKIVLTHSIDLPDSRYECSWEEFLVCGTRVPEEKLRYMIEKSQDPYALSDIMYTSGSTSLPKGVMITHDMLLRSSFASCRSRRMDNGRRIFVPVPLFHMMAYNEALLPCLYMGGALIMSDQRYNVFHCLEMMRRYRANDIVCVSSIMVDMLTKGKPVPEDYPDMHHAYWASACPDWVWAEGKRAFEVDDITTAYGMTECGSTTTMLSPTDPPSCLSCCHGKLKDGGIAGDPALGGHLLDIKICDGEGNVLPCGSCGEVYCRGLVVTKGYYNNPEANARAFTADGWFRTEDLGILRENGYFTFAGRTSDIYKINGENVSPQFINAMICESGLVTAVETVGINHPKCGEVGIAFVDVRDTSAAGKAAVRNYCHTHLASFQVPRYIIFSDSTTWPRTGSGKINKAELKNLALKILEEEN